MPIMPTNPIVVNKTYDKYWMPLLQVFSPGPLQEAQCYLELQPFISTTGEMSLEKVKISIDQVFTKISNGDEALAEILTKILAYAEAEAKRQGKI